MAVAGNTENVLCDNGHVSSYQVTIPNFAGKVPFNFDKSINFNCPVMPTSWWFRLAFEESPDDESVKSSVTIKRTDHHSNCVNVDFWMKLSFSFLQRDIPMEIFTMRAFPRAHRNPDVPMAVVPSDVIRELGDQPVNLEIGFGVNGCYKEKEFKRKFDSREITGKGRKPKLLPSRM